MSFSKSVREGILSRLQERGVASQCGLCKANYWILPDGVVHLGLDTQSPNGLGDGNLLPMVTLVCGKCGNTIFINLKILDLGYPIEGEESGE